MADWTEDEIIIALEFYYNCPERMHTDSHDKCKEIAEMLGRTPGALDRIIRNIKYADTGGTGLEHASSLIHSMVSRYQNDRRALKVRADSIREVKGWPDLSCED